MSDHMKYYLTTTIKKSGESSLCVYILASWDLPVGREANVEIRKADATENDPTFTFIATIRTASTSGGKKLTIPKLFGLNAGEWITISIEMIEDA